MKHLLVLRFLLLNIVGGALLWSAYLRGLVHQAVEADRTRLVVLIGLLFLAGLALCAYRVWQASRQLEHARRYAYGMRGAASTLIRPLMEARELGAAAAAMRASLAQRIAAVRHVSNTLVLLGLVGTVVGFIIALSGVDPSRVADLTAVSGMISTLIEGMCTALYTTIVGAVLHMWLAANYLLLAGGTVQLIGELTEVAETYGKPRK